MDKPTENDRYHEPVLLAQAIDLLKIEKGKKYLDATLGGGGHTEAILKKGGLVLGLDTDPAALAFSRKRLVLACPPSASCWKLVQTNFAHLKKAAIENDFSPLAGALFDLGVSSAQLDEGERGFSFLRPGPLDMRMSPDLKVTAADLVNGLGQKELVFLLTKYGQEPRAKKIAKLIVESRREGLITKTDQLAELIGKNLGRQGRKHPATLTFQALRIAVNDELNVIKEALPDAFSLLEKEGRLVVISFHSLEDRLVKEYFRSLVEEGLAESLTPKPIEPDESEKKANPRSRSAKLRAVLKK